MALNAQDARPQSGRYFLLESYLLKGGNQGPRLAAYLQEARVGMAARLKTPAPALILEALVAAHMPQVLTVSGYASLDELAESKRVWRQDVQARAAMERWEVGDEAPYETRNEIVLESAPYCPAFPPTAIDAAKPPRVYELRTYHSPTERQLQALHERFAGPEIKIFQRCGIHPVLYSSTYIGPDQPNLTYLTPFDDLAAREKAWAAFGADPEWVKVRTESIARSGQVSSVIQVSLFKAAAYSPVR
jgi:hypothetical protein